MWQSGMSTFRANSGKNANPKKANLLLATSRTHRLKKSQEELNNIPQFRMSLNVLYREVILNEWS